MQVIRAAAAVLLRQLGAALVTIGSFSCADLLLVAQAEQQRKASPLTPDTLLTPDEERAWADLVARLVLDA
jgi:hypothetical protein